MAKTVETSAASYMTPAELFKRCDVRVLADLCSDSGERLGSPTDVALMKTALASDPVLEALQLDASGRLEQACMVGGRYHEEDITLLVTTGGAGAAGIYRILTRLTVMCAYERRPDRELKQPEIVTQSLEDLQALRDGIEIFPLVEAMQTGVVQSRIETPADVEYRNGPVYIARRLFGRRVNREGPF